MEKVTIRLAKSLIGRGKEQIAVAHSLGPGFPQHSCRAWLRRSRRRSGRTDQQKWQR